MPLQKAISPYTHAKDDDSKLKEIRPNAEPRTLQVSQSK
jgi:hypothetical protein